ncbi:hypothetical protein [Streptomyces sp. CS014]|uniref:hypothetical protein n=1 Tax=Streptomyces sp. CS014 TaxID=2162707 RepID=UPI0031BAD88B
MRADPAGPVPRDEGVPHLPTHLRAEVEHLGQGGQFTERPVVRGVEETVQPDRPPQDDVLAEHGETGGRGADRTARLAEERRPALPERGEYGGPVGGAGRGERVGVRGDCLDAPGERVVLR